MLLNFVLSVFVVTTLTPSNAKTPYTLLICEGATLHEIHIAREWFTAWLSVKDPKAIESLSLALSSRTMLEDLKSNRFSTFETQEPPLTDGELTLSLGESAELDADSGIRIPGSVGFGSGAHQNTLFIRPGLEIGKLGTDNLKIIIDRPGDVKLGIPPKTTGSWVFKNCYKPQR